MKPRGIILPTWKVIELYSYVKNTKKDYKNDTAIFEFLNIWEEDIKTYLSIAERVGNMYRFSMDNKFLNFLSVVSDEHRLPDILQRSLL